jgi:tricorn protease
MKKPLLALAGLTAALIAAAPLSAQSTKPHAGMLRFPDVSATHIVFVYANDLWIAPREGGLASPLASPPGTEQFPRFSPDGKTIAFMGNYDGNGDIYTISAEGGVATRVTHHPSRDLLNDWAPGDKLLYASGGFNGMPAQAMFTVKATGGMPERLPIPYGSIGALSADGKWLAYTPHTTDFRTWKRYRGGMATDIWLFDLQEKKSKKMTNWEGTDTSPMWQGSTVYYLTDNGPEHRLNIWSYDTKTGKRQQVTKLADYDVKFPSIGPGPKGGGEIVFQYGSGLYLLDLPTGKAKAVEVRIPGDRPSIRAKSVDASKFIANWNISPTGKRAVVEARGDVWTAPGKEGSPRNLTRTSGVAERDPAWSPDGRWIAYFSDATGEYELYLTPSDGKGEPKQLTKGTKAFLFSPVWSPDSKQVAFSDKAGAMLLHNVASGQTKEIDRDPMGSGPRIKWSHDSRWITYAKQINRSALNSLWVYDVEKGEKKQLTSGMFEDMSPTFDRKGDYLYFVSKRTFRPTYEDFGTTWIYTGTNVLMAVPLRADMASPFLPKSDEEAIAEEKKEEKGGGKLLEASLSREEVTLQADEVSGTWSGAVTGDGLPDGRVTVKLILNLAGTAVTGRIETSFGNGTVSGTYKPDTKELNLTLSLDAGLTVAMNAKVSGNTLSGTATANGQSHPIRLEKTAGAGGGAAGTAKDDKAAPSSGARERVTIDFDGFEARAIQLPVRSGRFGATAVNDRNQLLYARLPVPGSDDPGSIKLFDINDEKKEEKNVAAGATNFEISADGKKILLIRGATAAIQDASAGGTSESVVTSGMATMIEPRQEWRQLFEDAWRLERDYFYDPNMHGVNWKAVHDQYAKMLDDAVTREDVSYIISEMISEMNVGHAYYSGGDVETQPSVPVGLLGADYALENGAYCITRIYNGAAWDSDARSPLGQPGVKVKVGDYLLAVNGVPIDTKRDPWAAFQGTADRVITITVSDKPKIDSTARDVAVRPIASEQTLRYRAWIEKNRAYVEKQTGGKVGYVYVPDTGIPGQNDLVRQLVGQRGKEGLIIDERWNGGGQIPTRFIELLNRPVTNYWARRDAEDWAWPPDAHRGPKVMLINGLAGSGGDAFPFYFRQSGLGKLIGMRTWGGLVGLSGNPDLIDGASVSAPTFAFYKTNSTWGVEGHGVDPDIEVVDDPALMTDGGDPQLDVAIKTVMEEIKQRPFVPAKRPAYPDRKGIGIPEKDR